MNLSLSPADQIRLQVVNQALLSPLDYADVDEWRYAVNDSMKELVGADVTSFMLPVPERVRLLSREAPVAYQRYPELVEPLHKQFAIWDRHVQLGVCDRDTLWRPHLDEYYRSAYYNEYIVPHRAFDYIGTAVPVNGTTSGYSVASMLLHHERETGPKFGERGLNLLRLTFPAFKAGVRTFVRLQQHRLSLFRAIDSFRVAVAVFDFSGRLVHRNSALARLLEGDPEGKVVAAKAAHVARACINVHMRTWGVFPGENPAPPVVVVSTCKMKYRLSGSYLGAQDMGADTYVLVTVEPSQQTLPATEQLVERFGFTKREAEIALLLAQRKRNKEIADGLCISERTARHHSEQVLLKLGVHSRDDVAKAILV